MSDELEVWLDVHFLDKMIKVGRLAHDNGQVRFNYDKDWLKQEIRFSLDPKLSLDASVFFPKPFHG